LWGEGEKATEDIVFEFATWNLRLGI
jgi:hypothetical protein